jgi:hypothetical protein
VGCLYKLDKIAHRLGELICGFQLQEQPTVNGAPCHFAELIANGVVVACLP